MSETREQQARELAEQLNAVELEHSAHWVDTDYADEDASVYLQCACGTRFAGNGRHTDHANDARLVVLARALAACALEAEERLEGQIVVAELEAQIIEATWWNEEGLDLENYISPEDAQKRLNFLRNTLKEVKAGRAAGEGKS